jgi:hypothetical protein
MQLILILIFNNNIDLADYLSILTQAVPGALLG